MENEAALQALSALAHSSRLDAFRLLVRHEPEGLPAGEVARRVGVPQNTLSTHLAILARSGLVHATRQSRLIIYRADLSALRALVLFLVKDCCEGRIDLCAPLIAELVPCCPVEKVSS
ncbi:helix-turn-helix transcriptional regulator [Gluconacetobacter azotocaptans]|uniref:Helix-turn-helix transcriptional regulator n=1 Tax=Gluconacetobacter azotocaptans TaxID=142834 RepID=A0A7W4JTR1_9PROT|nr:metalloregulator ArsR/SmtB family transcription factor [Gluconacetobacter azotocaptans]MBB2190776.1 helix-turn-helix transcriptional regulator [Gluconacetobacter azotocaptans]MBM9400778.1 helix-turn-helix transcriptional regulator [Gluconacetobacter azotocaptans]GBQ30741.1 ArsR family transcriptional regulator [Gluconacetobacter azotocaptans DSM 13594]